jgi:hypothetical protein
VSTLAALTGMGVDLGVGWPLVEPTWPNQPVVLVARASAAGTWAAAGAVDQWRNRLAGGVRVLGLVLVDASPRRAPKIVADRLQLLGGWVPQLWRVGWQDALLAVEDPRAIGMPPDVQAVQAALAGVVSRDEVGAR